MQHAATLSKKDAREFTISMQQRWLLIYILIAAASLFLTLWVPISGEEGNYTMTAMEMKQSGHWFTNTILGIPYARPPLMKFLVMVIANVIGFKHVLIASRLLCVLATLGTAAMTYTLTQQLSSNKNYALWATAIYLSGDLLLRRGWLAYADPLFAFFIMGAFSAAWLAVNKRNYALLFLACCCVCLGFITKEPRVYTFYASLIFVLLLRHHNRGFLWSWPSLVMHTLTIAFPALYSYWFNPGYLTDILAQLGATDTNTWRGYLTDVLFYSPGMLIVHLMPISVIALWALIRQRHHLLNLEYSTIANVAFWVCLINWLPCWLSWGHWPAARYYMPTYPLFALAMGYVMLHVSKPLQRLGLIALSIFVTLKITTAPWLYTYLQNHFHNTNHMPAMAKAMLNISQQQHRPVYIQNKTAVAVQQQIAHTIDVMRWPQPVITDEALAHEKTYNVITIVPRSEDHIIKIWPYHHFNWYLSCHGPDCRSRKKDTGAQA